ncbi:YjbE family integral membrane protein [Beijerinckia sp. GAS462]|nr:YjbE family integral membrane protein [Beijerinckia sp. GAS462]SEB48448.1 integral membrane protein, YjbE family [Beijerinckia sp. 28-YEA-48]
MLEELFAPGVLTALFQVIMIDLVLAGDNAVVIGLAAAGLPKEQRGKVIVIGIVAATVLRIVLALMTTQLLQIVGLLLAGGILLLWVSWKMWRELRAGHSQEDEGAHATDSGAPRKTFRAAVWQIIVADLSMSLDNVLAVGGAAREHPWVLVFGLALSIALMGLAATWIASLLQRHRWIGYAGLAIIVYVAFEMVWRGWNEITPLATRFVSPDVAAMVPFIVGGVLGLIAIIAFASSYRRRHSAG